MLQRFRLALRARPAARSASGGLGQPAARPALRRVGAAGRSSESVPVRPVLPFRGMLRRSFRRCRAPGRCADVSLGTSDRARRLGATGVTQAANRSLPLDRRRTVGAETAMRGPAPRFGLIEPRAQTAPRLVRSRLCLGAGTAAHGIRALFGTGELHLLARAQPRDTWLPRRQYRSASLPRGLVPRASLQPVAPGSRAVCAGLLRMRAQQPSGHLRNDALRTDWGLCTQSAAARSRKRQRGRARCGHAPP